MADNRAVDAELKLECDLLVLDTIVYKTTESLLNAQRQTQDRKAILAEDLLYELQMVESFLTIFKTTHVSLSFPGTIRFRLQLLRFATLFMLRHQYTIATPLALTSLRSENHDRAERWRERADGDAFPADLYKLYQAERCGKEAQRPQDLDEPMLMDLIPSLIELTAARAQVGAVTSVDEDPTGTKASNWTPTTQWLNLVATMQVHAVLESFTTKAESLTDANAYSLSPLLEAFAWGPPPSTPRSPTAFRTTGVVPDSQDSSTHHDTLFHLKSETRTDIDDDHDSTSTSDKVHVNVAANTPGSTWRTLRTAYLEAFIPPHAEQAGEEEATPTIQQHLQDLQTRFPLVAFEMKMALFLEALHLGLEKPLLVQLEHSAGGNSAREGGAENVVSKAKALVVDGIEVGAEEARQWRRWAGLV